MNVKDRTGEFKATVESVYNRGSTVGMTGASGVEPLLGRSVGSPRHEHSEFTRRATEINGGIQRVLGKLEKLTKLAQNKTAFDDRPIEVQELTQVIKADLAKLNAQISDLQGYQKMRKAGGYTVGTNKSAEEHSSQVVVSLQTRLKDVGVSFTNVLENRSQSLRAQKDRREQFSATNIMMPLPPSQISRQRSPRSSGKEDASSHVSIEMPSSQTGGLQQLQLMSTASDTAYLESRNVALQGIEATINELGTIYQQLATMISEQGETVQRIDMNIENMHYNIERGQSELAKYLRSISSNRWLMIKLFAILIVFIIFWSVFLL